MPGDPGLEVQDLEVKTGSHGDGQLLHPWSSKRKDLLCPWRGCWERKGGREAWEGEEESQGPLDNTPLPDYSIHNGVIAVFQRKGLPDHELFSLNEGVR